MPRKSAAELAVTAAVVKVEPRPVAPSHIPDDEAQEWEAIVSALPADWFSRDNLILLEQHVHHIGRARRLSQLIAAAERANEVDVMELKHLYDMQEKQTRLIQAGATKMRLSQQTKHDREKGKGGKKTARPWDK